MHKLSYQPGTSMVHRLYPLTKFAWLLVGTLSLFAIQDGRLVLVTALLFAAALFWTNPAIWHMRGFRLVIMTGAALFLLYVLFEKSGLVLFDPGIDFLRLTTGGLQLGMRFSGRFLAIVFMSYVFILTTDPSDLAYALMKVGLPYRFGFMLVTALRLAPVMEDEGQTIYRAQLARGIRYDQTNLKKVVLLLQQFLTPLLISALRRADKLVFSMEGRGFGAHTKRTFRQRPTATHLDLAFSFGLTLFFATLLFINYRIIQ
ncbi:MAG: energy-coupling factor transporter transmembrane component T family protein [Brevefilum sp.]